MEGHISIVHYMYPQAGFELAHDDSLVGNDTWPKLGCCVQNFKSPFFSNWPDKKPITSDNEGTRMHRDLTANRDHSMLFQQPFQSIRALRIHYTCEIEIKYQVNSHWPTQPNPRPCNQANSPAGMYCEAQLECVH